MILVLTNGERVEIFRQTCGHHYEYTSNCFHRDWNINPIKLINKEREGFFVIAKWGSGGRSPCEKLIPIRSVLYIEEPDKWELPENENEFIGKEEMGI